MYHCLEIQRYQNVINQGGHPIALVSMVTTLCEKSLIFAVGFNIICYMCKWCKKNFVSLHTGCTRWKRTCRSARSSRSKGVLLLRQFFDSTYSVPAAVWRLVFVSIEVKLESSCLWWFWNFELKKRHVRKTKTRSFFCKSFQIKKSLQVYFNTSEGLVVWCGYHGFWNNWKLLFCSTSGHAQVKKDQSDTTVSEVLLYVTLHCDCNLGRGSRSCHASWQHLSFEFLYWPFAQWRHVPCQNTLPDHI